MTPTGEALRHDRESSIRAEYERLHPDGSFDNLTRRARFSKEDEGVLREWRAIFGAGDGPPTRARRGSDERGESWLTS